MASLCFCNTHFKIGLRFISLFFFYTLFLLTYSAFISLVTFFAYKNFSFLLQGSKIACLNFLVCTYYGDWKVYIYVSTASIFLINQDNRDIFYIGELLHQDQYAYFMEKLSNKIITIKKKIMPQIFSESALPTMNFQSKYPY